MQLTKTLFYMALACAVLTGCEKAFQCGDPVSYQGYDYQTVLIGEQCWFSENLRSENYNNGDPIYSNLTEEQLDTLEFQAGQTHPPYVNATGEELVLEYGRLYNWGAASDSRGLCPSGWHVPSHEDFLTLEIHLGLTDNFDYPGLRGTDQGTQMKADYGWVNGGAGTNTSGFSALPAGYVSSEQKYLGEGAFFWTSSETSSGINGKKRHLLHDSPQISNGFFPKGRFLSIRCLQDSL